MLLHQIIANVLGLDVWIGSAFNSTVPSILILGESTFGSSTPLQTYVPAWIAGTETDAFFTRVYTDCSASPRFKGMSRQTFWNSIAFYNYVPGSMGPSIKNRPTPAQFKSGIRPLHWLLDALRPAGVFVIGYGHADYSRLVVQAHGIPYVIVPHPRKGVASTFITQSLDVLVRISA